MSERTTARAAPAESAAPTGTVARRRARAGILAASRDALREGATVLIAGDAGFGKSVLLDDLAPRLTDWIVVRAAADPQETDLEFSTAETLSRVIAGLSRGGRRSVPVSATGSDAFSVGRAILNSIDALPRPVCLMIDNAQWVDPASAAAIRYVARRLAGQPFFLIAAGRSTGARTAPLLGDIATLAAHHHSVTLLPFTERETQALATEILGFAVSRRTAGRLTRATSGSPILVAALVEQLGDSISHAPHPAVWDEPLPVSPSIARAVAAALESADPRAADAAELVAVLRDPVTVPAFGTIADQLGLDVDPAAAGELGLVHTIEGGTLARLEPPHTLIADALEARVPRSRRSAIHRIAADVLSGQSALRHRIEAADRQDAELAAELVVSARECADRGEPDTAMHFIRSALHLAPAGPLRSRCLLETGLLAMRTRRHERILDLLDAFEALEPGLIRDAILVELRIMRGDVAGSFALAGAVLSRAEASADQSADARALRSHVAGCVPMLQMATRRFGPVIDQVEAARGYRARAPQDPELVSDPALRWLVRPVDDQLWLLGWELTAAAHMMRRDVIERAAAHLDRLTENPVPSAALVDAFVTRARAFILTGDLRRARADLERAGTFTDESQPSWTTSHGRTMLAHVLYLLGDWDLSIRVGDTAVATVLDETILTGWPVALASSALARAARGQEKAALQRLDAAAGARPVLGSAYDPDLVHIARAELARALGRPAEQLAAADAGRDAAEGTSTMGWMSYRIDALAALERPEEARAGLELCREVPARWRPYYGDLHWLEGRVLESEGELESAKAAYLRSCAEQDARLQPFLLGLSLAALARVQELTGDAAAATASLVAACGIFETLSAAPYLERARTALGRIGEDTEHPVRAAGPLLARLTSRERDVARSVAAGMTNKEIAAHLFVSVTTVNFHVRNILAKLKLASRHELRRILTASPGRDGRFPVNS